MEKKKKKKELIYFIEIKTSKKKVRKFHKQRWIGIEDSIERIIINYDALINVYLSANTIFIFLWKT